MTETIQVDIQSPEEVVWSGRAQALSSENEEGPFDILPEHANFMTLVKDADVVLHFDTGESQTFSFDQAVLYFHEDVAKIYVHTQQEDIS